jgi:cell division protein FtsZ
LVEIDVKEKDDNKSNAKIVVIGVGGAGNNAINRMVDAKISGVKLVGVNTDTQALKICKAPDKVAIGAKVTQGLGAGAVPEVGEKAAEESTEDLESVMDGADMVIVTCGMGGGTGTGAAPVIAKLAKDKGILTVAIVTKPFLFEGRPRMNTANGGIEKLRQNVDTLIVIQNEKLFKLGGRNLGLKEGFRLADQVLQQSVQGITSLINSPYEVNLDFADVRTTMKDKGIAQIGIGTATGDDRALEAVKMATESPLLDTTIEGASNAIVCMVGNIKMEDVSGVLGYVENLTGEDANIIWGAADTEDEDDSLTVTVIATGLKDNNKNDLFSKLNYSQKTTPRTGSQSMYRSGITPRDSDRGGLDINVPDFANRSGQEPQRQMNTIRRPVQPEPKISGKPNFLKNLK